MKKPYWEYGEKKILALVAEISNTTLSSILHRNLGVSVKRARKLEASALEVLGKEIPATEWMFNDLSKHPAFIGPPKKRK